MCMCACVHAAGGRAGERVCAQLRGWVGGRAGARWCMSAFRASMYHVLMRACEHASMRACVCECERACTGARMCTHAYTHAYICVCMHTCMHMCMHAHVHAHVRARTCAYACAHACMRCVGAASSRWADVIAWACERRGMASLIRHVCMGPTSSRVVALPCCCQLLGLSRG